MEEEHTNPTDAARLQRAVQAVARTLRALHSLDDEVALAEEICRVIVDEAGYVLAWVGFAEHDEARTVRFVASSGFEPEYATSARVVWSDTERGRGPTGFAIREGTPQACRHIPTDPRFAPWRDDALRRGFASSLALPLREGAAAIGALNIYASEPDAFDEPEIDLLASVADGLSAGIRAMRARVAREQATRAVVKSEERFRALAASVPVGIFETEASGRIVYSNARWTALTGSDSPAAPWLDTVHPDDRPRVVQAWERALTDHAPFSAEFRVRASSGEERVLLAQSAVLGGDDEEFIGLLGTLTDLTEHRTREQTLRLQSSALAASADGVMITRRNGDIEWVNRAFTRLTGYTSEEVVGSTPRILRSGEHPDEFYEQLWTTIARGGVWRGELINKRKDGVRYREEMTITPVRYDSGQISHFVAIKNDITKRRELEEQLAQSLKMEAVGVLAGGVAHDFNNLLTAISGYAALLLSDLERVDPRRGNVVEIRRAADRATTLTEQLLAFSRRQVLEPRPFDLNQVIGGMTSMLRRIIGEDIQIVVDLAPCLGVVFADPGQLEQVILNLAVNARDAMPTGGVLTIRTTVHDPVVHGPLHPGAEQTGRGVVLEVRDTGRGMDAETASRIFEPFFTTKPVGAGTGLGLSMVYGVVQQSGGTVQVETAPGQGTCFRVVLSLTDGEQDAVEPSLPITPSVGSGTLMIVEDDAALLELVALVLERAGFDVLSASHGDEALAVLDGFDGSLELLITDVVMPGMSGPDLAGEIRKRRPGLEVLYISGYADPPAVRWRVVELDGHFLRKPFVPSTLLHRIAEILGRGETLELR